ncbi:hypothetical protein DZ860_10725 [Vibrio sinensis]|uniref:YdcF family protein n=1 Tax=Vibrio sinensis TaxID=2302434 RepID=A0A3A6R4T3_9VIBR|nr:hypothetical protein [Vibrio sinensis]RJX71408.1 hypothetical protein DZ860_10725 [Vibrio sinensis]
MHHFYRFIESIGYEPAASLPSQKHPQLSYQYHHDTYLLEEKAKLRLQQYLMTGILFREDFGGPQDADVAIAFSFGDSLEVNRHLAQIVREVNYFFPDIELYLQNEIAAVVQARGSHCIQNNQYQTTYDVAHFVAEREHRKNILIIAQAWHAQRCIETCEQLGFVVRSLRVVNAFPINDPQPWVRNPINWVIKESHRAVASGYEISKRYQLD